MAHQMPTLQGGNGRDSVCHRHHTSPVPLLLELFHFTHTRGPATWTAGALVHDISIPKA